MTDKLEYSAIGLSVVISGLLATRSDEQLCPGHCSLKLADTVYTIQTRDSRRAKTEATHTDYMSSPGAEDPGATSKIYAAPHIATCFNGNRSS